MSHESNFFWSDYVMFNGQECEEFWKDYLEKKNRNILLILGLGFDPRMCKGAETILNQGGEGKRDCLLIKYDEGEDSPSKEYEPEVQRNQATLLDLFADKGAIKLHDLKMRSADGRRIGDRQAASIITQSNLNEYDTLVVDVSAMPLVIYYPLLAKILFLLNSPVNHKIDLHVLVVEDVELDKLIQEEGIDEEAHYIHYFSSPMSLKSDEDIPIVWIPVLGENKEDQLRRIYYSIKPKADEICPVLPSPSKDSRRSDNILFDYNKLLFNEFRIEPQNIIYTRENNPFETYRQIFDTIKRYNKSLEPLGGCKVALSAVSSKLLSVGVLLAAYKAKDEDYRVGISHIEADGYKKTETDHDLSNQELFSLWLAGECYSE